MKVPTVRTKPAQMDYTFSWTTYPFGFAVTRKSTGDVIFNSTTPASMDSFSSSFSFLFSLLNPANHRYPISLDGLFNGLVFEDQYLEMSTQLSTDANIYGLGERVRPFRLDNSGKYYTFFATDIGTPYDINLYGTHTPPPTHTHIHTYTHTHSPYHVFYNRVASVLSGIEELLSHSPHCRCPRRVPVE